MCWLPPLWPFRPSSWWTPGARTMPGFRWWASWGSQWMPWMLGKWLESWGNGWENGGKMDEELETFRKMWWSPGKNRGKREKHWVQWGKMSKMKWDVRRFPKEDGTSNVQQISEFNRNICSRCSWVVSMLANIRINFGSSMDLRCRSWCSSKWQWVATLPCYRMPSWKVSTTCRCRPSCPWCLCLVSSHPWALRQSWNLMRNHPSERMQWDSLIIGPWQRGLLQCPLPASPWSRCTFWSPWIASRRMLARCFSQFCKTSFFFSSSESAMFSVLFHLVVYSPYNFIDFIALIIHKYRFTNHFTNHFPQQS